MAGETPTAIGVLTSGGDAPGMNAVPRAVVRTALSRHLAFYAISDGCQGRVDGGERIRALTGGWACSRWRGSCRKREWFPRI